MDDARLRALLDYVQSALHRRHETTERLGPRDGEQYRRVEERSGYIEVVKTEPCAAGCDQCPHGPFRYHVTRDDRSAGGRFHWTYLGRVVDGDATAGPGSRVDRSR